LRLWIAGRRVRADDTVRYPTFAALRIAVRLALLIVAWQVTTIPPAVAQGFVYNASPARPKPPPAARTDQMMVQAALVEYDYTNARVAAVGQVQMFYNGTAVEADRIVYDQKAKRLHAEGNVRITDAEGRITYANLIDLSDDYRDGFVDSLHVDTADATRMAATRAERSDGNFTVFQNGVYTACAACRDDPKKPPLWQVKGARILHDQTEKMLYFEDARLEFFGVPLAYIPYFSTPDPTVKRKSGLLMPQYTNTTANGIGIELPLYWAIGPDRDATLTPRTMQKQGVLMQSEFRQRLMDGAYQIRGYGIQQQDRTSYANTPGDRETRGGIESSGQFAINDKWLWGWDAVALSDYTFLQDYRLSMYRNEYAAFLSLQTEAVSQLYLTGIGSRSVFDARMVHYLSFSGNQSQVPVIRPVIDTSNVLGHSVLGGEVSYKTNFTSLSRDAAAFDPISALGAGNGVCTATSADPLARTPQNCLLRGIPGSTTRLTGETQWRRSFTDSAGEIWTPFAILRADAIDASISNQPGVSNFLPVGDTRVLRAMPAVGLDYRYPFIDVQPWGTTTLAPVAQLILRPDEPQAGRLPNEDAQSLTFDAGNLFRVDKFSGYDRVEGGGRANVGVQAATQFDRGGSLNALFGQSYQLFGLNSFAVADLTNTAVDSGLATPRSDYVARLGYAPNRTLTLNTRARLDEATLQVSRFEAEGRASFDRWSVSLTYGNYAPQLDLGYLTRREGLLGTGSIKLASNWVVTSGARWDLEANKINQNILGAGYVDDCFVLAANYVTSYNYTTAGTAPLLSHGFMLQLGLRTLGTYTVPVPTAW